MQRSSTGSAAGRGVSNEMKAKKLAEARQNAEEGMKFIRKTLFHWTPDHLSAAPFFEKSAAAYAVAQEVDNAKLMWIQAADSQIEVSAFAAAANDLKKAAKIAADAGSSTEAADLYQRCADCWRHYGQPDKASEYLLLAAVALSDENPEAATTQVMAAVDAVFASDDDPAQVPPQALDHLRSALSMLLKHNKYDEAQSVAEKLAIVCEAQDYGPTMCFARCAVTVLQLTKGDIVQADATFMQHLGSSAYLQSKECKVAESLINAFKNRDADALEAAQNAYDVVYLDRDVIKLVKQLGITVGQRRQNAQGGAAAQEFREQQAMDDVSRDLDELLAMTDTNTNLLSDDEETQEAQQNEIKDDHEETEKPHEATTTSVAAAAPAPPQAQVFEDDEEDEIDLS